MQVRSRERGHSRNVRHSSSNMMLLRSILCANRIMHLCSTHRQEDRTQGQFWSCEQSVTQGVISTQAINGKGAFSRFRRQRHQDSVCGPNRSSHKILQDTGNVVRWECTRHERCWRAVGSGTIRHEDVDRDIPDVIARTWANTQAVAGHSAWRTHEGGSLVGTYQVNVKTCKLKLQPL